jgi:hypothetical protein
MRRVPAHSSSGWAFCRLVGNPRLIEVNPLLVEIESEITRLKPDIRRVSSGRSGLTDRLTNMLWSKAGFDDVLYLEGRHVVHQVPGAL